MIHLNTRTLLSLAAVGASTALVLSGCSADSGETATPSSSASATSSEKTSTSSAEKAAEADVTFDEAVVRAKGEDNHMTAVFGTLVNHSDKEITITGFSSSLDAPKNQMHETVDGVMREMEKPLVIPAGESHELAPGGDHLMIMDYAKPVAAGDTVDITFDLADGGKVEAKDVPVRTILAGEENYGDISGQEGDAGHGEMNHGEMNHEGHEGHEGAGHGEMDHSAH